MAFTLVESMLSLVIVATMLSACLGVAGTAARARNVQRDQSRAFVVGRQLLAEILQCSYQQPNITTTVLGPESGETRATYNDVDDFNGLSESPPATAAGVALPGYSGWQRSVKVEWVDAANPATVVYAESGLKRITVTVISPSGRSTVLTGLRSQYGSYEHTPGTLTTYTSWIGVTVDVGSDSTSVSSGANLLNQVP